LNKGKVIWQKATLMFYHIRQMAALVANLFLVGASGTPIMGKGEVVGGQQWYQSKERWCFL